MSSDPFELHRAVFDTLGVVRHLAEFHVNVPKTVTFERNHQDEPFLDLAVASGARYLVTRDKICSI